VVLALMSAGAAILQHYVPIFDLPLLAKVFSVARVVEPAEGGGYKAGGLHFHRLRYAHTLVPLLVATLPLMRKRVAALVAIASLCGLYFTYTRAAWLAIAVACVAFVLPTRWPWFALLAVPLIWAGPPDRGVAWETARELFATHPWAGVGYGGYTTAALALKG